MLTDAPRDAASTRILVLNGPNLNMLGTREPDMYGTRTLSDLEALLRHHAAQASREVELEFFQSNHEGALIDALQDAHDTFDGVIFNPGAYSHYSYALRDAVASIQVPVIEVHLSDISQREEFRRVSVVASVCVGQIMGKGFAGYSEALDRLLGD